MDNYQNAVNLLAALPSVIHVELVEIDRGPDAGPSKIIAAQIAGYIRPVLLREHLRSALGEKVPIPPLVVGDDLDAIVEEARRMTPTEFQRLSYEHPRDDLEALLAELWADVLQLPAVSANDSFMDIGGDSSAMVVLIDELECYLGASIDLFEFMDTSSVREQAAVLRRTGAWDDQLADAVRSAWRDVLSEGTVGLRDDFFGVGGNLHLATSLSVALRKTTGKDVQPGFISDNRTILEQIRALASLSK